MRTLLFITFFSILELGQLGAQTITPIYFINDSIEVSKVKILTLHNGLTLKTKSENKLLNVIEPYPDTVIIIIPFKDGSEIILDSVPTKYLDFACVIDAKPNILADKHCCLIYYLWGDLIKTRIFGTDCHKLLNFASIYANESYFERMTKGLGVNLLDRMNSKEFFERMQKRNN